MRVKVRTFSGVVCEQEVFSVSDRIKNIKNAEPRERFKNEEERARHRWLMSRRHHARVFNSTFSPQSLYSTLTMDDAHEVHTFQEARKIRDLYTRRLQRTNPDAQIMIYMGRGKSTSRIHFHMVSNGLDEKTILSKWREGDIKEIKPLRAHNYYDGVDCGQDYTGLANYLFDHWTPEQGERTHKYKPINVCQPEREKPTEAKRSYSESRPPVAPKGYRLVQCTSDKFGHFCFKYIKDVDIPPYRKR